MRSNPLRSHMPTCIGARNVNEALYNGLWWLATAGYEADSRNGPVLVAPGPVITHYTRPQERVLFNEKRDANPFFHLYEAIWMLAGRRDSASVARYAKTMDQFADDDGTLNGAYGYRWRFHFGFDQLQEVISELRRNPTSRRAVLTMWDPEDLKQVDTSKDVPCNTQVYFSIDARGLSMTVCNRSNDMIWGGYGANYVHMGVLQEFIAAAVGVPVGSYFQMSNNFHVYPERLDTERLIRKEAGGHWSVLYWNDDRYDKPFNDVVARPMFEEGKLASNREFLTACAYFAEEPTRPPQAHDEAFWKDVFSPMMRAHAAYKAGAIPEALAIIETCMADDWRVAGTEWLERREAARVAKAA